MSLQALRARFPVSTIMVGSQPVDIVRTRGRGLPLVLLPGAQGTAEMFFNQLLAWGAERDIIAVTYPGWTDGPKLADYIVDLCDGLAIDAFDVVGTSYGGYVAQWLAARHADRVRRLVVGNSFSNPKPVQSPDKLAALESKDAAAVKSEALARAQATPDASLKAVLLDLMGEKQGAELLRSRMLAVQRAVDLPELGIPDSRVLLIECDNDPLISPPMREALRARHPGASQSVIDGGGHYPYITRVVPYNAAVSAFLDA